MSLHLIIGDKLHSSWSLRGALALDLTGASYTEELIKLNRTPVSVCSSIRQPVKSRC